MRILFVRHAEPDYEHDTLTEKGFREAHLLTKRLQKEDIHTIYVSPLGRALDTIEEFIDHSSAPFYILDWLSEVPGVYKNLKGQDIYTRDEPILQFDLDDDNYDNSKWKKAKEIQDTNIVAYYELVCRLFDNLLESLGYKRKGNYYKVLSETHRTILIVCHLGIQSALVSHLVNIPFRAFGQHFSPAPSSVTTIYTEERVKGIAQFRIQSFGDVSHLYAGKEEISFAGRFRECASDNKRK